MKAPVSKRVLPGLLQYGGQMSMASDFQISATK